MAYRIAYVLNDKQKELVINNDAINFNIIKQANSDTPKFTFIESTSDAVKYSDLDKVWDIIKDKTITNLTIKLVETTTKQEFNLYSLDNLTTVRYNFQLNREAISDETTSGIPLTKILSIQ